MKRVEFAKDYSEFIIRSKFVVNAIQKAANDGDSDVAKYMAHELKITAMLLDNALDREIAKKKS